MELTNCIYIEKWYVGKWKNSAVLFIHAKFFDTFHLDGFQTYTTQSWIKIDSNIKGKYNPAIKFNQTHQDEGLCVCFCPLFVSYKQVI